MDLFGLIAWGIGIGAVLLFALIGFIIFRAWYQVPKADEAIVIVGKKARDSTEGEANKMTVISGRGAIVNKLTQRSDKVSLRSRQIKIEPTAQTINGVTIDLTGVALVKIGSTPTGASRGRALRVAGRGHRAVHDRAARGRAARRRRQAHGRRGHAGPAEAQRRDRRGHLGQDLLVAGPRARLVRRSRASPTRTTTSPRSVRRRSSASSAKPRSPRSTPCARSKTRQLATDEANLIEQTALDKNSAAAKSEVGRANAQAEQAENLARAEAEQGVLLQEANNTQARLDAEVKKVADADKYKQQSRPMPRLPPADRGGRRGVQAREERRGRPQGRPGARRTRRRTR